MEITTWVLVVYMGISAFGPGGVGRYEFPSEESCHKALHTMRIDESKQRSGDDDEQILAMCVPKQDN